MTITKAYNRDAAVAYAHRWAFRRNPVYADFSLLGGDCTNFVSQCLHAGGMPENNTKNHGWYYRNWAYRTPSWSGVNELYRFLTADAPRSGPVATEAPPDTLVPGDVIQLSFAGQRYGHSLLVVAVGADGIRIATHTYDADYRRLESYDYKTARGLHVLGAT